jgi:hypothetical protein
MVGRGYVAEPGNDRILRIDNILSSGAYWKLTTFGTAGQGVNEFDQPRDVALDTAKRIYIADRMNDRIVWIQDMVGTGWQTAQTVVGPKTCPNFFSTDHLCEPVAVFVDGLGRIYIREYYARTSRMDNMTGAGLTVLGSKAPGVYWVPVSDVFLDGAWRIYWSDYVGDRVERVDDIASAGAVSLTIDNPSGVFVDGSGRIYVTSNGNHLVRFNDISGSGSTEFPGGRPNPLPGSGVHHLSLDTYGRIYFTSASGLWRMNDMGGAGLVRVAGIGGSLGGIWVDDGGP